MKNALAWVCLVSLTLLSTDPAFADSDSYYCEAEGLLVYDEMRPTEPYHVLHVVRFGASHESFQRIRQPTPGFQIHTMKCEQNAVTILGGNQGWWIYRFSVSESGDVQLEATEKPSAPPVITPSTPDLARNLGHYSESARRYWELPVERIPLRSNNPNSRYVLEIRAAEDDRVEDECKPLRVVTTIQRIPESGEAGESLTLYDRSRPGECAYVH